MYLAPRVVLELTMIEPSSGPGFLPWIALLLVLAGAIVAVFWFKGRRLPGPHVFRASRLSRGNLWFPTQVAVTPASVPAAPPYAAGRSAAIRSTPRAEPRACTQEANRAPSVVGTAAWVSVRPRAGASRNRPANPAADETAELTLDGMLATLIGQPRNGTRAIEPMLGVTRMCNSICAAAFMRRGVALARAYATRREAFGERLDQLPLHVDTLAMLEAETWGAFLMAFQLVELYGKLEAGEIDDEERALLRLVTPLTKLATGKQAVATVSSATVTMTIVAPVSE